MKKFQRGHGLQSLLSVLAFVALASLTAAGGRTVVQVRAEPNKELAHILGVNAVRPDPELTIEPSGGKGGLVNSPDRKYSAYVLCVPMPTADDTKRCGHVVHFDDYTGPKARTYQIRGEPELEETTRPVDNLKWVNSSTVNYERWSNPHFGHRYVIDVRSKKQLAAYDLFG